MVRSLQAATAGNKYEVKHALEVIYGTYWDVASVTEKQKDLLKFGSRTTVGTGWETVMTALGSETEETFVADNLIDSIVSSSASDVDLDIVIEGHTVADGVTTFVVQTATLDASDGTTAVALDTPLFRVTRIYNADTTTKLVGNIYVYEDDTGRTDAKTHISIPAGEQKSQKAATTISSSDYWIVTNFSLSVLTTATKYAQARIEVKPTGSSVWLPITQNISCTDTTGTIELLKEPYIIVPKNYDVRLAVKTNTSGVAVAGGFSGYLASVLS